MKKYNFVLRTHTFVVSSKVMRRVFIKSLGNKSIFVISDGTNDTARAVISRLQSPLCLKNSKLPNHQTISHHLSHCLKNRMPHQCTVMY